MLKVPWKIVNSWIIMANGAVRLDFMYGVYTSNAFFIHTLDKFVGAHASPISSAATTSMSKDDRPHSCLVLGFVSNDFVPSA